MKIIIDCSWVCYRGGFGMTELSYNQKKVHVIWDFLRQLQILALEFKSTEFVFCFDSKNSYRKIRNETYKANRGDDLTEEQKENMAEIRRQMTDLRQIVLPYMGFKNIFYQSGYEADDLIATASLLADEAIIVASDEDLFQLLNDNIRIYNFKRIMDTSLFKEQYFGIEPIEWANVKAIAGCSGDNVIGIHRVGNTTAAKWIAGKLNKGKAKDSIESEEGKNIAKQNLPLVKLPYKDGLKSIKFDGFVEDEIDLDKFKAIFGQYGFNYFLKDGQWDKWVQAFVF